jgi:hypothetical protein
VIAALVGQMSIMYAIGVTAARQPLNNLILVCIFHHAEIHKPDSWTVFLATDGLPTFIPPPHVDPLQRPRRNRYHPRQ